jgi:hypothetical protein
MTNDIKNPAHAKPGDGRGKRLVIVESPFAGDVRRNLRYLRACLRDSLLRGEAPYASHAIYTQPGVLNDDDPEDRKLGMSAGFAYRDAVDVSIVYTDLGITPGMQAGIEDSAMKGRTTEYRSLGPDWEHQPVYKTRWE